MMLEKWGIHVGINDIGILPYFTKSIPTLKKVIKLAYLMHHEEI
jgi:hypothetical protein